MKRLFTSAVTVGVALLCVSSTVMGQFQLGTGRALDRNLRDGSGGRNDSSTNNNRGLYQDALVTGNTGGLSRFRGNIGYRAPGEFSGDLPSNNNFRFYLQTLPQTTSASSIQTGGLQSSQAYQPSILTRAGGGVLAGQLTGQYTPYGSASSSLYRNDVSALNLASAGYGGAMPLNMGMLASPRSLATGFDSSGRLLQITATPLTGVRTSMLGAVDLSGNTLNLRPLDTTADPANSATPTDPRAVPQPGTKPFSPQTQPNGTTLPDARLNSSIAPTLLIATQLGVTGADNDARLRGGNFRADVLDQQIFHPEGWSKAEPGKDVYADFLARIAGQSPAVSGSLPPGIAPDRLGTPPVPSGKELPKTGVDKIAEDLEKTNRIPDAPIAAPVKKATQDQKNVDALMDKLAYNLPPLPTLVGSDASPFNAALGEAEKSMAAGKYFIAEDAYLRAMTLKPNHPLAEIGRVHAQIGAGLYLSAGFNLRTILLKNPQIIAARFSGPLLPDHRRMVKIDDELQQLQKRTPNEDAALLQAYLAYQRSQPEKIKMGLDIMLSRNAKDPLIPVVQRIWLGKTSPAKPTPSDKKPATK